MHDGTQTQSNVMRLLVLQMTVNEMLKNPQHLWHFLDLLKSLKTPRKSFLAAEKDNHCKRTLLTFSLDLFSPDWTKSDPIFCCWILDWSHLRQGRRVSAANQADYGYVSQTFLQHLISMLFVACFQSQAQVRVGSTRESLHYLLEPSSRFCMDQKIARVVILSSVSASHNIITSLRDTSPA